MALQNCPDCGKLIVAVHHDELCQSCKIMHIQQSKKVRAFIAQNPHASRMDIHLGTGVSLRIIDRVADS